VVVAHGDTWNLGTRDLSGRRRARRRGEHAVRSGREHAWPLSWRRRDRSLRARGWLGQRDALHADWRPLECRGVVSNGGDPAGRRHARGPRSKPASRSPAESPPARRCRSRRR
jgi:hypothetical protein